MTPDTAPVPARPGEPVPRPGAASKLRFTFKSGSREGASLELGGSVIRIGRGQGCAVWAPEDRIVSAQHAKVVRLASGYVLIDLESTNGTYLNGRRIQRAPIGDGDVIGLGPGGPEIEVVVLSADRAVAASPATVIIPRFAELAARKVVGAPVRDVVVAAPATSIGRGESADLRLDAAIVSRRHARLTRMGAVLTIEDLDSSNGTFVQGKRVARSELSLGDVVVVGPFQLVVDAPTPAGEPRLRVLDTRSRARIDARDLAVVVDGRRILEGVSLSMPPGSFTAIIGPSGAGKSTLLTALSGARPATSGGVLVNGVPLYEQFESLKSTIGYVPQDDIVHQELSVEESLGYTARLRLPPDTSKDERQRRIADVLATLELTERRSLPIHRLSGGQRKRVSIGTEMLTEPNILFLDEPTSGLDPGLEEALMLLLRELSYKGKTVVLVTHTLEHIDLCDAVVLLVDGRLAFYGPSAEARRHFGIDHLVNLYSRLKEKPAAAWQEEFAKGEEYAERVAAPLAAAPAPRAAAGERQAAKGPGWLRQWGVLTARYQRTIMRDAKNAALLLAQAPLIAGLIGLSLLYGQSDIAYTKPKNTLLFLLALTSVWFGCSNAARELVKERAIFLRERMVNLRTVPYVLSKVGVLGALAVVQCVLFLGILDTWFSIPGSKPLLLGGMVLASVVGILLGLALSALVGSGDRAMTLLPILLIPQVLFTSPAVQMDMKGPAGLVARAMPTWWAYDFLRRAALAPDEALDDDAIEARLLKNELTLMTRRRFESMVQQGYMMFQYRGAIETTWTASPPEDLARHLPERLGRWRPAAVDVLVLGGFAIALLGATVALQRRHDRR